MAYHPKGNSGGYTSQANISGTSPLTLATTFTPLTSRAYTAALIAGGGVGAYAITVQASNFEAIGDGFNKLRGVAPGCNWAGAKVFSNAGSGSSLDINAGIDGLVANRVAHNIKLMNVSLGIVGNPGISTSQRAKVNTAVNNGVMVLCSAGNDGGGSSTGAREIDDPGRAALALTVAASDDNNQLTDYTSIGFSSPGATAGQEEDYKPDLMAPGGSAGYYTSMMSIDSNSGDGSFSDQRPNDYYNIQGTSMATPFAAGCAALVIDALQQRGTNWNFSSSQHPRLVKMLLCATSSESNANRDSGVNNPSLQRSATGPNGFPAGKDPYEGYGMINPDAAVEAATLDYLPGQLVLQSLGGTVNDKRVWARRLSLPAGQDFDINLNVPGTGDFDLHLYSGTPSAYGTPVLVASSTQAGSGTDESLSFTPTIATNLVLVVKRISGSGTFELTGTGPVVADFTGAPTSGVLPLTVFFTNQSAGASNHLWTFGDGQSSMAENPTNTYFAPGTYSVTLTASSPLGTNTLTRTDYITVTNPPGLAADFSASPRGGVPPTAVYFTNLSVSASNYLWDFGDGNSSTATNPMNLYTATGDYTVTLTAWSAADTNAVSRTNYITITNFPPVMSEFIAAPLLGAAPLLVNFTNQSSGATNYLWDFGDGGQSSAFNPSHSYLNAGTYTVWLRAIGGGGTNLFTRTNYITVSNQPVAIVSQPQSLVVTQGVAVAFNVTATGSSIQYQWRKDGLKIPGATAASYSIPSAQPPDAGTYSVLVSNVVSSALSSDASLSLLTSDDAIVVTGPPYSQDFNSMGSGGTTTPHGWFVGAGSGTVSSKSVTVGDGSSNSGDNYSFGSSGSSDRAVGSLATTSTQRDTEVRFVNRSGTNITELIIDYTGEQWRVGGNGAVNNALVMQFSLDGVNFTAMGSAFDFNTPVDSGKSDSLNGNSVGNRITGIGATYVPSNPIPDGQAFYLRWADGDDSSLDHGLAVDDFTVSFTIPNLPAVAPLADFAADVTTGLAPLQVNFANLSLNATDYLWGFGDGGSSTNVSPSYTYTNVGIYSVSLTAVGAGGTNTATFANYIQVTNALPAPIADFVVDVTDGLVPLTVNFTNLSLNATNYAWDFGDGNGSVNPSPTHTYTNAGLYSVSLTAVGAGGTNALSFTNYINVTNPPPPVLEVLPTDLVVQPVLTGAVVMASFVVSNSGGSLLNATASLTPADFTLLDASLSPTPSLVFALPPLTTTNIPLQFTSPIPGLFSNAVVFLSDGGNSTNPVSAVSFGTPVLALADAATGEFVFAFETVTGVIYQVEYTDFLPTFFWSPLQTVIGDGSTWTITNLTVTPAQRFYRIRIP